MPQLLWLLMLMLWVLLVWLLVWLLLLLWMLLALLQQTLEGWLLHVLLLRAHRPPTAWPCIAALLAAQWGGWWG
jgi:hypothetical protein